MTKPHAIARDRWLRLAAALVFATTSACSAGPAATERPSGSGCVVELELVDGGPGLRLEGSGFPPDEPATLGLDDGRNATVLTQAEAPALHTDVRGVVRFDFGAERENVGTNRVELSAGGCTARDSIEITAAMFPPACPTNEPVPSGGAKADAYEALVVGDEPIAYWRFEEVAGPIATARVGELGAFQGNPRYAQPGPISGSRAVALDGDGDWIDVVDLELPGDFTIEGWIFFCENDISNDDALVGNTDGGPNLNFFDARLRLWTGELDVAEIATPMDLARWYQVAAVRAGGAVELYVDGISAAHGGFADPFRIGTLGNAGGGTLAGLIDEVAIYDHALSAEQLAAHAAAAS